MIEIPFYISASIPEFVVAADILAHWPLGLESIIYELVIRTFFQDWVTFSGPEYIGKPDQRIRQLQREASLDSALFALATPFLTYQSLAFLDLSELFLISN